MEVNELRILGELPTMFSQLSQAMMDMVDDEPKDVTIDFTNPLTGERFVKSQPNMAKKYPSIGKSYNISWSCRLKPTNGLANRSDGYVIFDDGINAGNLKDPGVVSLVDNGKSIKIEESGKYLIIVRYYIDSYGDTDADGNLLRRSNPRLNIDDRHIDIRKNANVNTDDLGSFIANQFTTGELFADENGDKPYAVRRNVTIPTTVYLEKNETVHVFLNSWDGVATGAETATSGNILFLRVG